MRGCWLLGRLNFTLWLSDRCLRRAFQVLNRRFLNLPSPDLWVRFTLLNHFLLSILSRYECSPRGWTRVVNSILLSTTWRLLLIGAITCYKFFRVSLAELLHLGSWFLIFSHSAWNDDRTLILRGSDRSRTLFGTGSIEGLTNIIFNVLFELLLRIFGFTNHCRSGRSSLVHQFLIVVLLLNFDDNWCWPLIVRLGSSGPSWLLCVFFRFHVAGQRLFDSFTTTYTISFYSKSSLDSHGLLSDLRLLFPVQIYFRGLLFLAVIFAYEVGLDCGLSLNGHCRFSLEVVLGRRWFIRWPTRLLSWCLSVWRCCSPLWSSLITWHVGSGDEFRCGG